MSTENKCKWHRPIKAKCNVGEPKKPPKVYPPFDVCVTTGKLSWDGTGLSFVQGQKIPTGTYTSVSVVDGCITSMGIAPVEGYTPSDCCAAPGGAHAAREEGGVLVSPAPGNTIQSRPDGLYAATFLRSDDDYITVSGNGTQADPYSIKLAGAEFDGVFIHGQDGIVVSGSGTQHDQINISLASVHDGAKDYGGLRVDRYGRVVDYTASADGIKSIVAVAPLKAEAISSSVYQISVDTNGDGQDKEIVIGNIKIVISSVGTIKDIVKTEGVEAGSFITYPCTLSGGKYYPPKRVRYDANGIILSVEETAIQT